MIRVNGRGISFFFSDCWKVNERFFLSLIQAFVGHMQAQGVHLRLQLNKV